MNKKTQEVMFSSEKQDWGTPQKFFSDCSKKYGMFDLDVCASPHNVKCSEAFGYRKDGSFIDGLKVPWNWCATGGDSLYCWMNPPYGEPEYACKPKCKKKKCVKRGHHNLEYKPGIIDWVKKAYEESLTGRVKVCCLLPARTDTKWFHEYCQKGQVIFIKGRLKFEGAENSAPFPSMLVLFGYENKL